MIQFASYTNLSSCIKKFQQRRDKCIDIHVQNIYVPLSFESMDNLSSSSISWVYKTIYLRMHLNFHNILSYKSEPKDRKLNKKIFSDFVKNHYFTLVSDSSELTYFDFIGS